MPVIPVAPEADARESHCLNSGGRGCCEVRSRHCTAALATKQDSISKEKKLAERGDMLGKLRQDDPLSPGCEL